MQNIIPNSIADLAAQSGDSSTMYFLIGDKHEIEPLSNSIFKRLGASESLVQLDESSECLCELERPRAVPALGAWSSLGVLIGYAYEPSEVDGLVDDARRFVR